jgi:hypothetical protein
MFAFVTGRNYPLPFTTAVVHRRTVQHMHRAYDGSTWKETMDLEVRVLAARLDRVRCYANNDNEKAA